MPSLSARTLVIVATICFAGLVALQVAWIRSASEGELALYLKEKRQFEIDLQTNLKQNESFRQRLKQILDNLNSTERPSDGEHAWFTSNVKRYIDRILSDNKYDLFVRNFGIIHHAHRDTSTTEAAKAVVFLKEERLSGNQIQKAGQLCLHCILGLAPGTEARYNYQLVLLYGSEKATIYKKMALLILGSFLFLVLLGLLFREMLKKYQQEKKLSEVKNEFINNLSHELQTPVFVIQMANRMIKEKTLGIREVKPFSDIIEKETYQLKQHAGKILELASLENEQVELHKETTDLNSFIEEKEPTLRMMLQQKEGELKINYHNKKLYSEIDRVHFNNLLLSLTENAIKYNKGNPRVTIETGEKGEMICLKLTDNGVGIAPQYLPFVFDKFYRVPESSANGATGFGLGLSYVKQIVDLHKGQVTIKSEEQKFTTITILLPKTTSHV